MAITDSHIETRHLPIQRYHRRPIPYDVRLVHNTWVTEYRQTNDRRQTDRHIVPKARQNCATCFRSWQMLIIFPDVLCIS